MTAPWKKGVHSDYTAFVIEVHVRRDREGNVASYRRLQGPEDQRTSETMEGSHGMVEGSWALLTESARSELMLQLLVKLSNDPEFKQKLASEGDIDEGLLRSLSKDTLEQLQKGLKELLPHLTREAAETVRDGLRTKTG
jgi:hypothetical protein